MRLNWVDLLTIGLIATVGAFQFLRGIKNFSQILYEALLLIVALVAATALSEPLGNALGVSRVLVYIIAFVVLGMLGILLATTLNKFMAFDLGVFNYLFAMLFGVVSGWVIGHTVLRSLTAIYNPGLHLAIRKSWMASQVLHFGAFWELLAILRIARWRGF